MIVTINIFIGFVLIVYIINKGSKEKIEIVRELTKALSAKNLQEYTEVLPEDGEEEIEEQEVLEEVDSIDANVLIKHLNKQYENKQD